MTITRSITAAPSADAAIPRAARELPSGTTHVELETLEGQSHRRLLFGHPVGVYAHAHPSPISRQTVVFEPGARFALELWEGTTVRGRSREPMRRTWSWRILVLEAAPLGSPVPHVPYVTPGAWVLMDVTRIPLCRVVKTWLATLEEEVDPAELRREFFLARDLRLQSRGARRGGFVLEPGASYAAH